MKNIVLPKIVAIGMYNAQLAFKDRAISPNRKTTMFELELPMEAGGVSYIDDTTHPITENVVICAKPGQLRHTRLPFKCWYIHMIVNEGQLCDTLSSLPNYIPMEDTGEIHRIFLSLCKHYGTAESEIILQSLVLQLVYILNRHSAVLRQKHMPKTNNHQIIEDALAYISKNLSSELSLERMSDEFKFSPIYFHKLFKASTGRTLHQYVEEQRIQKSIELLTSTDMTLTQIAYECGFSSQSYFSYAFKKKTMRTPREYARSVLLKYEK